MVRRCSTAQYCGASQSNVYIYIYLPLLSILPCRLTRTDVRLLVRVLGFITSHCAGLAEDMSLASVHQN